MPISARKSVEHFHLVFLRALVAKGEDKGLIALKGGCNLRFYFASPRYSEDIDFDVAVMAKQTLKNKVERLLQSPIVSLPLRTKGIKLIDVSAPKQTDTTQRWKVGLLAQGSQMPLRTKIEFSRRGAIEGALFEGVHAEVARVHQITPVLATHYAPHAAVAQKIAALAGRAQPQARDVFDLHLLLARADASIESSPDLKKVAIADAIDRTLGISFDEYTSKVYAYLDPDQADLYQARSAWEAMQQQVVARLEALV